MKNIDWRPNILPTGKERERLKEWLELADDIHDIHSNEVKGAPGIDGAGCVDGVAQRYSRGEVACHLHIQLQTRGEEFHTGHFCIEFRSVDERGATYIHDLPLNSLGDMRQHGSIPINQRDWFNFPVFVDGGQVSDVGEGMENHARAVPGVVRLIPLDDCPMVRTEQIQRPVFLEVFGSGVGGGGSILDRELDPSRVARVLSVSLDEANLPNEVVQGPSDIMNDVSNDEANAEQQILRGKGCHPVDVLAALRVELDAKSYSVAFDRERCHSLALKDVKVLFSPL